jgi:hypothetical protein
VRIYDGAALALNLRAAMEVTVLIQAAHKFLDALDRFWIGEKP